MTIRDLLPRESARSWARPRPVGLDPQDVLTFRTSARGGFEESTEARVRFHEQVLVGDVIVNQTMAERNWPGTGAIDQRVTLP